MGQLSFVIPDPVTAEARRCLDRAHLAGGYDRAPVPAKSKLKGQKLTFTRDTSESVYLTCPWPVPGYGEPVVVTSTLRERPEPYHILTELARGTLNHVRNQLAEWEGAGLEVGEGDLAELGTAVRAFGRAVLDPGTPAAVQAAEESLAASLRLGDRFTTRFSELLLNHRVGESGPPPTRFGARLFRKPPPAEAAEYIAAFNAVRLVPSWRSVEPTEAKSDWGEFDEAVDWAVKAGLAVSIGPLVDLAAGPFPDWLGQWEGDLPSLAAFMCDFVETAITRYRDRVTHWLVFAGFNHADALGLNEDDRLRLAARLLEAARLAAPSSTLTANLSLTWGDYLASGAMTYSPLVFVDTLLRGGLQLGGLELELLCGNGPRASRPHSLLDVYGLLDLFALLGVPLELALAEPTGNNADAKCPTGWAAGVLDLAVSVSQVTAIHWDTWTDADPNRVDGCPLWTKGTPADGHLAEFRRLRQFTLK